MRYESYYYANRDRRRKRLALAAAAAVVVVAGSYLLLRPDGAGKGGANPLVGNQLYADPESNAARQAKKWQADRPQAAADMRTLADLPAAKWLTSAESFDEGAEDYLKAAADAGQVPVLVAYNIPYRDCGMYSSGGAKDLNDYESYIDRMADIIGDKKAAVIVEPDAVANLASRADGECLDDGQRQTHYDALAYATDKLGALPATAVYLDAGHSAWVDDLGKLASALRKAGIGRADGFSLNVSNFQTTEDTTEYGSRLSAQLNGAHFVIDTSRNGMGSYENPEHPDFSWCNPPGRALGHYPTTKTDNDKVDAYLYIKSPGESDGQDEDPSKCAGGPKAGEWWPDYALGLVRRWPADFRPDSN